MKTTMVSFGIVMLAILLVVSAGCLNSSSGNSAPVVTPEAAGGNSPAAPAITNTLAASAPLATNPAPAGTGSPQLAKTGDTVSVYYTGMFENGTVFDSNMNGTTPMVITLGKRSVIQGFEDAVTGMSVNQEKTVTISYDNAYGAYNPSLVRTVFRVGPLANATFVEGQIYTIHDRTTDLSSSVKILQVNETTVTWDANNPLAGQNLRFIIKLAGISPP
jgi:peptidylprolyl isomerase